MFLLTHTSTEVLVFPAADSSFVVWFRNLNPFWQGIAVLESYLSGLQEFNGI
jgi:hypothetical protein